MNNLPPIVIFGFIRHQELENCLSSLESNMGAKEFSLHIFIDGPRNEDDIRAVEETIKVTKRNWNFKEIEVIARDINLGLSKSIQTGLSAIFERHESAIVVEDDLVLHPEFLNFMIQGLQRYVSEKTVASIQGFSMIELGQEEGYFLEGADCWGWATWRDRWESTNWDSSYLLNKIKESGREKTFNLENSYNFSLLLELNTKGKINSWAINWQASMFLQDRLSFYPPFNLVDNQGFNQAATHTRSAPQNLPRLSYEKIWKYPDEIKIDRVVYLKVAKAYSQFIPNRHLTRKIVRWVRRFFAQFI